MKRSLTLVFAVCCLALFTHASARAQAPPVDLALILAVDASGSVDQEEWLLQLTGYVQAMRDPEVHRAIKSGGQHGAIALTFVQWSGYSYQVEIVGWTRIASDADAVAFADKLQASSREIYGGGTSLSGIIDYSVRHFGRCPFPTERRVVDISGDGANRDSRSADMARDDAVKAGITINGLPILGSEADLDKWYQENVVGGFGAFMVVAEDYVSFARAIKNKLIREIAILP